MLKRSAALLCMLPAALAFPAFWRRRREPAWTGPFTPDEYADFLGVIGLYFGVHKVAYTVRDGELTMEGPRGPQREHLQALAELCHGAPRERWPELIAQHFAVHRGVEPVRVHEVAPDGGWVGFRALVEDCFRRHGFAATVEADGVVASDGAGRERRFAAPGLERRPQALPREEWARFVDGVFGEPLRALRGVEALAGRGYEEMRGALAVQLFEEAWLSDEAVEETVYTRDLPGLLSALVCRLPQATFRLPPETLRSWGREKDEVFSAALANLRRLRPEVEPVPFAPGLEGMRLQSLGPFVAAQALLLADYGQCSGPYGALVAVPRRGLLLVCPLRPLPQALAAIREAARGLVLRIVESEREGHAPLSRRLYWYREGRFRDLPYDVRMEEGQPSIELRYPLEFLVALEAMDG